MSHRTCTEADFVRDIEHHRMTVLRNDGMHRHIRFRRPSARALWFDLITWPGTLCIDGDMGTFVFRRLEDMFEFFRGDAPMGASMEINPDYWAQKLQSSPPAGAHEFDPEAFRQMVTERFDAWVQDRQPHERIKRTVWEAVQQRVLCLSDAEDRAAACIAASEFRCHGLALGDVLESRLSRPTYHYLWCCYAIVWGVRTYDAAMLHHQSQAAADDTPLVELAERERG